MSKACLSDCQIVLLEQSSDSAVSLEGFFLSFFMLNLLNQLFSWFCFGLVVSPTIMSAGSLYNSLSVTLSSVCSLVDFRPVI